MSSQTYREPETQVATPAPEQAPVVTPPNSDVATALPAAAPPSASVLADVAPAAVDPAATTWTDAATAPGTAGLANVPNPSAPPTDGELADRSTTAPVAVAPVATPAPQTPREAGWSAVLGGQVMEKGAKGPAVEALQQRLRDQGYKLDVDGDFGPKTREAVMKLQRKLGVPVDGDVGPITSAALDSSLAKKKAPPGAKTDPKGVTPVAPKTADPTKKTTDPTNPASTTPSTLQPDQLAKLKTMATADLESGATSTCVTTVRQNLRDMGLGKGIPGSTGADPNNPRGMMTGMLNSGEWESMNIPGSTAKTIKSPAFGETNANVLTKEAYLEAMKNGQIPDGALVFQASKAGGWDYNGGSKGNDVAINRNGSLFNFKDMGGPEVYKKATSLEVVVVVPKSKMATQPAQATPATATPAAATPATATPATATPATATPATATPATATPATATQAAPATATPATATPATATPAAQTPVDAKAAATVAGVATPTPAMQAAIDGYLASVPKEMQANAQQNLPHILKACAEAGVTDPNQVAYILATAQHETGFGQRKYSRSVALVEDSNPFKQNADGTWTANNHLTGGTTTAASKEELEKKYWNEGYGFGTRRGTNLGNREGTDDGANYRGRGFVQLTGRDNYSKMTNVLSGQGYQYTVDGKTYGTKENPIDLLAHPEHVNQVPELAARILVEGSMRGTFTGRALGDYISGNPTDAQRTTQFTNARAVINGSDKAAAIAGIANTYAEVDSKWSEALKKPAATPTPAPAVPTPAATPAPVVPAAAKATPAATPAPVVPAAAKATPAATPAPVAPAVAKAAPAPVAPAVAKAAPAPVVQPSADRSVAPAAQPAAKAAAPQKEFVELDKQGKIDALAKLMNDNRALMTANNVSSNIETKMASAIPQEIDNNSRRQSVKTDFLGQATSLQTAMKGVDLKDPKAVEALKGRLNEEQRHLLGKVQGGQLDLAALSSKDVATKNAALETLTNQGIELRSNQYGEMMDLRKKQEAGTKLTKEESARLTTLSGQKTYMGRLVDGNMTPWTMGDMWGMSKERFGEIYAAGNTRFEPNQYRKLRDSYIANKATNDAKKTKDPTVLASSSIGNFDISATGQAKLATNYDMLGDMATSYGAGQIMGGYAKSDDFRGQGRRERLATVKNADGTDYTPTVADLKAAGTRLTPNGDDLKIMMSLVSMKLHTADKKGNVTSNGLDNSTLTNDQWVRSYNGHQPGHSVYQQYLNSMDTNGPLYEAARKKVEAEPKVAPKAAADADAGVRAVAVVDPSVAKAAPAVLKADATPTPEAVVAKVDPVAVAADPAVAKSEPAPIVDPAKTPVDPAKQSPEAKVDPATTPAAAAFQEKMTKEYTPLLKTLETAKTPEERQAAALAVANWNRANMLNQPDVQAYLARTDISMEEKTATMGQLTLEIAKSEFLAGWAHRGGVNQTNPKDASWKPNWETEGTNKGAFPSHYLDTLKVPLNEGENSPWCTTFVGYAQKQAGFQYNNAPKGGMGFSPFWSGSRLDAWARTGKTSDGKTELNAPGSLVADTGGRHNNNFGTMTGNLDDARTKKGALTPDALTANATTVNDFVTKNGGFQPGDTIVLDDNNAVKGASHTVMVDRYDPATQTIYTIEGNKGNKVTSTKIDLKDPKNASMLATRTRIGAEMYMTPETLAKSKGPKVEGGKDAVTADALLGRARSMNTALATTAIKNGWINGTDPNASVYDMAGNARETLHTSTR